MTKFDTCVRVLDDGLAHWVTYAPLGPRNQRVWQVRCIKVLYASLHTAEIAEDGVPTCVVCAMKGPD